MSDDGARGGWTPGRQDARTTARGGDGTTGGGAGATSRIPRRQLIGCATALSRRRSLVCPRVPGGPCWQEGAAAARLGPSAVDGWSRCRTGLPWRSRKFGVDDLRALASDPALGRSCPVAPVPAVAWAARASPSQIRPWSSAYSAISPGRSGCAVAGVRLRGGRDARRATARGCVVAWAYEGSATSSSCSLGGSGRDVAGGSAQGVTGDAAAVWWLGYGFFLRRPKRRLAGFGTGRRTCACCRAERARGEDVSAVVVDQHGRVASPRGRSAVAVPGDRRRRAVWVASALA